MSAVMASSLASASPYLPHLLRASGGYALVYQETDTTAATGFAAGQAGSPRVCKLCIRCRIYFVGQWDGNYVCPRCGTNQEEPPTGNDSPRSSGGGEEQAA